MNIPEISNLPLDQQAVLQKQIDQMKAKLTQIINESNIPPQIFVDLGERAFSAIKNKQSLTGFIEFAKKYKLLSTKITSQNVDYQLLSYFVIAGKVAEKMVA